MYLWVIFSMHNLTPTLEKNWEVAQFWCPKIEVPCWYNPVIFIYLFIYSFIYVWHLDLIFLPTLTLRIKSQLRFSLPPKYWTVCHLLWKWALDSFSPGRDIHHPSWPWPWPQNEKRLWAHTALLKREPYTTVNTIYKELWLTPKCPWSA